MELVGTSRTPIVSMVVFDDRLFVATTGGDGLFVNAVTRAYAHVGQGKQTMLTQVSLASQSVTYSM